VGWTANYSSIQRTFTTNGLSGLKLFKSSALAVPFDVYTNFFFPTLGIIVLRICFVFESLCDHVVALAVLAHNFRRVHHPPFSVAQDILLSLC